MVRSFRYQGRTAEDVKERANASGFDSFVKSKYKRYKIKEGKNLIRILPKTWEGKPNHYGYDVWLNYGIGADNGSYLSLNKHGKGKDPIAEARMEARREGDEETEKQLRPRQRILMWIIDRLDPSEGPQIMDAPVSLDGAFADQSFDEDTGELVPLDHPTKGCDIRFHKTGKGLNTKYEGSKVKLQKPSPISDDAEQQQEWLDYITKNPLDKCLNFYDYDYLHDLFNGSAKKRSDDDEDEDVKPGKKRAVAEDDDEDSDEAPPKRTKSKPKAAKPWADDDEDEPDADADSDTDDTDDDDDDAVSTKKRKPAPRQSDDDDDDDEDANPVKSRRRPKPEPEDDEDEEDAPPPPKKSGLRDRIKERKRSASTDADDEDDD